VYQVRLCVCVCVCARRCGIHKALHARTLSVCTLRSKTVHAHMHYHCACCLFCLAISLPDDGAPAKQPPQEQTCNYFQRAYAFQTEKIDAVCVCVCVFVSVVCVCVCVHKLILYAAPNDSIHTQEHTHTNCLFLARSISYSLSFAHVVSVSFSLSVTLYPSRTH